MMRIFTFIVLLILINGLTGCSPLEARKQHTLERLKYSVTSQQGREKRDIAIRAVQQSTPQSLRTPAIYDAEYIKQLGSYTNGLLVVHWIADEPTADGVRLWFSNGETITVKFPDEYLTEHTKTAKKVVIFHAPIFTAGDDHNWAMLATNKISNIALTLADKQITDPYPPREIIK
jgi:hypothetical protein